MGVISSLKGLFYPPKCVICGNILPFDTKTSFCPDCAAELSKAIGRKCPDCGLYSNACKCVLPVLRAEGFLFHVKLFGYNANHRSSPANRLVYRMKSSQKSALYSSLADMLAPSLSAEIAAQCAALSLAPLITFVPRSRDSVSKYGFDQAELLAKALAKKLSIPFAAAVKRKHLSDAQMKLLTASGRFSAGADAFEPIRGCGAGCGVVLIIVDDVLTSGASAYWTAKAASLLGVRHFAAVSVAQTY